MQLTRHELNGHAEFIGDSSLRLSSLPAELVQASDSAGPIELGLHELPRRSGEAHLYRLNHPLAAALLARAKSRELPAAEVQFAYGDHEGKVTLLEPLIGKAGWLTLSLFSVESLDQAEDHLIIAASTDDGQSMDEEMAARLLTLPGSTSPLSPGQGNTWSGAEGPGVRETMLTDLTQQRQEAIQRGISERNARFFEAEADKLDGWADDLKVGLEREIKQLDREIKEARRDYRFDAGRQAHRPKADQGPRSPAQRQAPLAV